MPQSLASGKKTLHPLLHILLLYCGFMGVGAGVLFGVLFVIPYVVNEAKFGNPWLALLFFNLIITLVILAIRKRIPFVWPTLLCALVIFGMLVVLEEALFTEYGPTFWPAGKRPLLH